MKECPLQALNHITRHRTSEIKLEILKTKTTMPEIISCVRDIEAALREFNDFVGSCEYARKGGCLTGEKMKINTIPNAQLLRFSDGLGALFFDGEFLAHSLENPAKQIPQGEYIVTRDDTGKHQYFKILDVPGRTDVEMHPANWIRQLKACVALGLQVQYNKQTNEPEIVGGTSRPALEKLSERLGDRTAFLLVVRETLK